MLLNGKDGIKCDYCGSIHQTDFKYYSVDVSQCTINGGREQSKTSYSTYDWCERCMDHFAELIKKHYKPVNASQDRRITHCELSGQILTGTYIMYRMNIDAITVNLSRTKELGIDHSFVEILASDQAIKIFQDKKKQVESTSQWTAKSE